MSKEGMNTKDFFIGTVIGGVVGALTALLLAPKSGKELRHDLGTQTAVIKDKTDKLTNQAKEKSSEYISLAKDKTSSISQLVANQSTQLMNKVKDLRNQETKMAEEASEYIEEPKENNN
ncbi:YtxH domain-containing protein [Bacillus sp. CLL-7-23]|uniref:YtxH domain-containing protein n=1 Tax=Bacillus changyiensis TaxID=3004103 RepID=A0ABT4X4R6_9BACI|nr:YtxH domain-containing protein [Bacillus changyiensis]MDA7027268.1 YtxH domain-containing protein [Bacillus changyiensis]